MNKKKLLTLPLEILQRDLYLNLYMALVFLSKDYQVIIGEQNDPVFKKTRNGIYFHKDHANWSEALYKDAKNRKMKTAAFDVEGFIYRNSDVYIQNRACKWILENIDAVFLWGDKQKELISRVTKGNNNFYIVGGPKFDVCNLAMDFSQGNDKRKVSKILINTRFSSINVLDASATFRNLKNLGVLKTQKDIEKYNQNIQDERKIFNEFLELIKLLSKIDGIKITIRPHPAEDDKVYRNFSSLFDNVSVDKVTNLIDQILEHDCVIHEGCTTAVEAAAVGRPAFGLRPEGLGDGHYANRYSVNFKSALSLCSYLKDNNICEFTKPDCNYIAKKSIYNWNNPNIRAVYKMMDVMNAFDIKKQRIFSQNLISSFNAKEFLFSLVKIPTIRNILKTFNMEKLEVFITGRQRLHQKYPDLDISTVIGSIKSINNLDKSTVLLKDVEIKRLSKKTILVFKKG
jgi:surface carbohydrate biosynthesis protein